MNHKQAVAIALSLLSIIAMFSCQSGEQSGASSPQAGGRPYEGPPMTVAIQRVDGDPVQHIALIELTAPTGGWNLQLDRSEVHNGIAHVYFTLERPAAGEMVTQALVNHRQRFISDTDVFDTAWVYVFVAERGISYLTPDYRLAATAGKRN